MGYSTDFSGELAIKPPLNPDEIRYLNDFADSRRCLRTDRGPLAVVPRDDYYGDGYNTPPTGQPGLWCHFAPNEDGTEIEWTQSEKTYDAAEWIAFLVTRLLAPEAREYLDQHRHDDTRLSAFTADHFLNGRFDASGEDPFDLWGINVTNNAVTVWDAQITPTNLRPVVLS